MKRFLTAAAALTVLMSAAGVADAQSRGHDNRDRHGGYDHNRGPNHNWRKGGRIETRDWRRGQRVDYRRHHLRSPPRGYEWRQVDGRYVLAAVATGVILSVLLANQ
jgi:Ni/Co efflux regulator RcnB